MPQTHFKFNINPKVFTFSGIGKKNKGRMINKKFRKPLYLEEKQSHLDNIKTGASDCPRI